VDAGWKAGTLRLSPLPNREVGRLSVAPFLPCRNLHHLEHSPCLPHLRQRLFSITTAAVDLGQREMRAGHLVVLTLRHSSCAAFWKVS